MTPSLSDHDASERGGAEIEAPDAFSRCIGRLEAIIVAETRIVKLGGKIDYETLNQRKSHALLEFVRVSRSAAPQDVRQSAARVRALQRLIAENAEILERRLQATEEITSLIVRHLRESESDGTYSIRSPRARQK